MDKIKISKLLNESGKIFKLEISGLFILDNSEYVKNEFVKLIDELFDEVHIIVTDLEDIDLSCIQLFVALFKEMDKKRIHYSIEWNIDDDQKFLIENIGLSNELYIDN